MNVQAVNNQYYSRKRLITCLINVANVCTWNVLPDNEGLKPDSISK